MFNLLKSDLYRLFHGKMIYEIIVIMVVCSALAAWAVWFGTTSTFAEMVESNAQAAGETQPSVEAAGGGVTVSIDDTMAGNVSVRGVTYAFAQTFITGGFLSLLAAILTVLFLVGDFDTGFVKNLIGGRRAVYYLERLAVCAILCAIIVAVGLVATGVAFTVAGFGYREPDTIGSFIGFGALAWLHAFAYAAATAAVAWATRSKAASMVFACLVSSAIVGSVGAGLAAQFAGTVLPAWVADAVQWLPCANGRLFGEGARGLLSMEPGLGGFTMWQHVLIVAGVMAVVCSALAMVASRRRDIQ